jgi:hypothetical protein
MSCEAILPNTYRRNNLKNWSRLKNGCRDIEVIIIIIIIIIVIISNYQRGMD